MPGTRADDGDPLGALVLHDASTYPGIVMPCRPLGLIMLEEDEEETKALVRQTELPR